MQELVWDNLILAMTTATADLTHIRFMCIYQDSGMTIVILWLSITQKSTNNHTSMRRLCPIDKIIYIL